MWQRCASGLLDLIPVAAASQSSPSDEGACESSSATCWVKGAATMAATMTLAALITVAPAAIVTRSYDDHRASVSVARLIACVRESVCARASSSSSSSSSSAHSCIRSRMSLRVCMRKAYTHKARGRIGRRARVRLWVCAYASVILIHPHPPASTSAT